MTPGVPPTVATEQQVVPLRFVACVLLSILALAAVPHVRAQQRFPDFDKLAADTADAIQKSAEGSPDSTKVLVLDFEDKHGAPTQLGHQLASQFADSLRRKEQGFVVLNLSNLKQAIANRNLPPEILSDAHSIKCYASEFATVLVKGGLNYTSDGVVVEVIAEMPKIPKTIFLETAVFPMSAPMKELASKFEPAPQVIIFPHDDIKIWINREHPPKSDDQVVSDGDAFAVGGYTLPRCIRCANPSSSGNGHGAKFQETVIFRVQILADGFPARISLLRGVPCGELTNKALDTVKQWTFKPAEGPDGKPVAASIPVEVTISLF